MRCFKRELAMQIELQWQTQKILFDIAAYEFDQTQGFAVAAEQQMLAVIELRAVVLDTACTATELFCTFKHGDRNTMRGEFDCRRHPRVAAADDSHI